MAAKPSEWRPGPSVCRCCLTEGCYKDISTEYFWMGKREVYEEMLSDTLSVSIAYSQSGGPNSNSRLICEPCISRLRDATDFRRQVLECERTFMQHLDPGSSSISVEESVEVESDVKLEQVKQEAALSDDDYDHGDYLDDDDDLDEVPLTKLASKVPKKESADRSVDLLDLLDNSKVPEKRKSTTKTKTTPAKKVKVVKDQKPSSSKAVKPEKKKKEFESLFEARRNAKVVLKYSTAYPFRLPGNDMMCVYCCETYSDPSQYRDHMKAEHIVFNVGTAFIHASSTEYVKVDVTELACRICAKQFDTIVEVAQHLVKAHNKDIKLEQDIGVQVFKLGQERWMCAICSVKQPMLRALSRHTSTHYHKCTCETCGKSYNNKDTLNKHIVFAHSEEKICVRCMKGFPTIEARRQHVLTTPKCWLLSCNICAQRFLSKRQQTEHLETVHKQARKNYACPECNKVFAKWYNYKAHFMTAHTNDHYPCPHCGLKFDSKRNLDDHKVTHTKEKLFPCTECSKSFVRKKNLSQHMWIHKEQKRFECKLCNKQFNQKVSWKTHMGSYHPGLDSLNTT